MSKIFELVLFTTGIFSYAEAFFNYFNSLTNNSFSEFLCRDTCVHIYKTIFFKDLRVIGNRSLKNMILLDNSVYCMGSLLNNGVPIISFTGNSDDLELMHI
jgi:CTD small phosphatase-like protein 2